MKRNVKLGDITHILENVLSYALILVNCYSIHYFVIVILCINFS